MVSPKAPEPAISSAALSESTTLSWQLTWQGCLEGCRVSLPILPALTLFGMALGAAAAQKGMSVTEFALMNAFVYAGQSQLVALGLWQEHWTWPSLLAVAIVTFTVNARMILMGASLHPWFASAPKPLSYTTLAFLTDANWIIGQRYYAGGGRDIGIVLGAGVFLWVIWIVAPLPGFLLGKLVQNPRLYALDLVMPVFFIAMVARLWKGRKDSYAWSAAAISGVMTQKLLGGGLHVIVGALIGMGVAICLTPKAEPDHGA